MANHCTSVGNSSICPPNHNTMANGSGINNEATLSSGSSTKSFEPTSPFNQALALHKAGRLAEAEKIYGLILKGQPNHFESLHLLGVSHLQRGNFAGALHQIDM